MEGGDGGQGLKAEVRLRDRLRQVLGRVGLGWRGQFRVATCNIPGDNTTLGELMSKAPTLTVLATRLPRVVPWYVATSPRQARTHRAACAKYSWTLSGIVESSIMPR